jgi:hypothetical protein
LTNAYFSEKNIYFLIKNFRIAIIFAISCKYFLYLMVQVEVGTATGRLSAQFMISQGERTLMETR